MSTMRVTNIVLKIIFVVVTVSSHSFQSSWNVHAFCPERTPLSGRYYGRTHHHRRSTKSPISQTSSDDIIESAKILLSWEEIEAKNEKPILNLSSRNASPEQIDDDGNNNTTTNTSGWEEGDNWDITVQRLKTDIPSMVESADMNHLLERCPQLYRLDSSIVVDAAMWLQNEFGIDYLRSVDGRLLSYKVEHLKYGIEFLTIMMMAKNEDIVRSMCCASSDMFVQAVEGGIQEREVQFALGKAGDASSRATQNIASEAIQSFRNLQDSRRHKK